MENLLHIDGAYQFYRHSAIVKNRPSLLFLHGLGESGLCFAEALERPDLMDFNLVIPDLAGFGKSVTPVPEDAAFGFESNLHRLWRLIETLDLSDITLVGHSIGGDLGVLLCESNRDRRIARFVNIEGNLTRQDMFFSGNAVEADERGLFEPWLHDLFLAHTIPRLAESQPACQRYQASLRQADPNAFRILAREADLLNRSDNDEELTDLARRYLRLPLPKVFCWGDQKLSAATRRALFENGLDHMRFNGSGHWVMLDRADAFFTFLREFAGHATPKRQGFFPGRVKRLISPRLEDMIDADAESEKPKHCYMPYMRRVATLPAMPELARFRKTASLGGLNDKDYRAMNARLEQAKTAVTHARRFEGYLAVNALAMTLAQILFVNNLVVEGMPSVIEPRARGEALTGLSAYLTELSEAGLSPGDKAFFADLFLYQVCFDRIFLMVEQPLSFDPETGASLSPLYRDYTAYLQLANKKVLTASDAEKALCRNITTGWGDGIDHETWGRLNDDYYSSTSKDGEPKLFTKYYDDMLERMLPQFDVAKFRLARTVVLDHALGKDPVHVLEIGSGSGSFAVDLLKACAQEGVDAERFVYRGIEPSSDMRAKFDGQFQTKMNLAKPETWSSIAGGLESVTADPAKFLKSGRTETTVVVFSFSPHHCYHESLNAFLTSRAVKQLTSAIYFLDGTLEHGWTKPYYMWVDCESPENFDNVTAQGDWEVADSWQEPEQRFTYNALTNAWCCMRKLI